MNISPLNSINQNYNTMQQKNNKISFSGVKQYENYPGTRKDINEEVNGEIILPYIEHRLHEGHSYYIALTGEDALYCQELIKKNDDKNTAFDKTVKNAIKEERYTGSYHER